MEDKQTKIKHPGNLWFRIAISILIIILFICSCYIAWLVYGYYTNDLTYITVMDDYVTVHEKPDTSYVPKKYKQHDNSGYGNIVEENDGFPDRDIDIDGLIMANPDFLCWIYYGDGGVDYPVVKEQENDINGWLHRAFDGTSNGSGTIFVPYDADDSFHDKNTFLYGHNMANGSIFGSLKKVYRNPAEKYTDPYFYIWTKDYEKIKYRIVSMYVVDKDSNMYAVPVSDEGYEEYFLAMLQAGSMSGFISFTDMEMDAMKECSPIVTLSTCYGYAGTSNRLLVQGVEIERMPYGGSTADVTE